MTDMEERELKAEDIPMGYPLCFNSECADKDKCMHYQARLLMPKDRFIGKGLRLASVCMHYSVAGMGRTIECITVRICFRPKNRRRF